MFIVTSQNKKNGCFSRKLLSEKLDKSNVSKEYQKYKKGPSFVLTPADIKFYEINHKSQYIH